MEILFSVMLRRMQISISFYSSQERQSQTAALLKHELNKQENSSCVQPLLCLMKENPRLVLRKQNA